MKRLILLLALVLTFVMQLSAQVAIGPGAPNLKSILDLSSTAKFLVLPVSTTAPDATLLDTVGAMIFYNGNIYLRTPSGIKVFTPWKWDGTNSVSSDSAKPVGIGTIPSSHSFRLQVADAAAPGVSVTASSTASIAIGIKSTNHLLIDNDEIMVKKDTTTADTLSFQKMYKSYFLV